jgi:hypothetical protein
VVIRAQQSVYRRSEIDPIMLPRNAGSWPGYVFTGDPLRLAAGHFGPGHGSGAHAPDEYYVIESQSASVRGMDGAARSYGEYLYELARASGSSKSKPPSTMKCSAVRSRLRRLSS